MGEEMLDGFLYGGEEEIETPVNQEEEQNLLAQWLEEEYDLPELERGTIREGTIVHVGENEILVDIGYKCEGVITGRELERLDPEVREQLQVGNEILVYVVGTEDRNGNIILSLTRAMAEADWRRAEQLYKSGEIFEAQVSGYNKGGVIVRLGRVRGFIPTSQLSTRAHPEGIETEEQRAKLVGQTLKLKVIELNRARNRLILSERAAMREWRKQQKEHLLDELKVGEIRRGRVVSLCDFGAFIDLGGADGLVHLSELAWHRVNHPSEVLSVGDEVDVYILSIDQESKRIGLSLKRTQSDPWQEVAQKYYVGQLVEGTITKVVKFGAFARLKDEDVEGLIHISELSDKHISHPREVVREGDVVTLRVIRIDEQNRRIGLSFKQVYSEEYTDLDWSAEMAETEEAPSADQEHLGEPSGEIQPPQTEKPVTEEPAEEAAVPETIPVEEAPTLEGAGEGGQ